MGLRGPKPTPSTILQRRGSWRGDANKDEPTPPEGAPECPAWLSDEAKQVWRQVAEHLTATRVLTRIDGGALARYCDAFVRWKAAMVFLSKHGDVYPLKDGNGDVKCWMTWPQSSTYNKLGAMLLRIEQEFGLTPSSRSRVQVATSAKAKDKKSRFFSGPKLAG